MKIWIMHHYAVNDTGDFEKDLAQYKDLTNRVSADEIDGAYQRAYGF
ncbi:MAG: hypothetical protein ACOX3Q_08935 [Clostridia bacterium]|jgi:hypothetical protein